MKNSLLSLLTVFLFATACSDDDSNPDSLPAATTTGVNTAGCYINGKILIAKDGSAGWSGTPYGLTSGAGNNFHSPVIGDDYFYVRIVNFVDRPTYSLWLQINDMSQQTGDYIIGQANGMYFADGPSNPFIVAQYYDGENLSKTYYSAPNAGTVTITHFDYENGIYSGVFNATLYNKDNPEDTIQVTDGRFDIGVATLNQD